jgi:hypothetical protein
MNDILKRMPEENESQYIWRIGQAKDAGLISATWEDLAPRLNMELNIDETEWRGESAWRKRYRVMQQAYDDVFSKQQFTEGHCDELDAKKRELEKAKVKLQTEKIEYRKWLREEARDELICEKICTAIKEMPPLEIPKDIGPVFNNNERSGVLLLADSHYGAELSVKGLFGETLNEYNPEIFEKRMWDLFNQVTYLVNKEGLTTLNVYDLGDDISGMLRVSQLMKLRYGVIESAVLYGRFMTEWLNKLTNYVRVKFQMVKDSNHNQLRLLGQPKNTFVNENVSYIIAEKLMDRLGDNPNFEFVQNPTGLIFDNLVGHNVLGIHGEVKNMERAIKDFSSTYKVQIDTLVGGHKHHQDSKNVGMAADVINAPSIIGIDDYSMSLNKVSDPGATLFILERGKGKTQEYNIKL